MGYGLLLEQEILENLYENQREIMNLIEAHNKILNSILNDFYAKHI